MIDYFKCIDIIGKSLLCKPFTQMSSGNWNNSSHSTNGSGVPGVEWVNLPAKNCDRKILLYGAMQSLY